MQRNGSKCLRLIPVEKMPVFAVSFRAYSRFKAVLAMYAIVSSLPLVIVHKRNCAYWRGTAVPRIYSLFLAAASLDSFSDVPCTFSARHRHARPVPLAFLVGAFSLLALVNGA